MAATVKRRHSFRLIFHSEWPLDETVSLGQSTYPICRDELFSKGWGIAKNMFVDDADQSVQLHQRVLQQCCRQQQLVSRSS